MAPYDKRDLTKLSIEELADPKHWPDHWDHHRVQQEWRRRELDLLQKSTSAQIEAAQRTKQAAIAALLAAIVAFCSFGFDVYRDLEALMPFR